MTAQKLSLTTSKSSVKQIRQLGFTFIELLIVVAIIAFLAATTIPNFNSYLETQNSTTAAEQLLTDLRFVATKALTGSNYSASAGTTYWGVKFEAGNDSYYYFISDGTDTASLASDCTAASASTAIGVGDTFTNDIVIRNPSDVCVFFSFDNGNTSSTGTQSIYLGRLSDSSCKEITVSPVGFAEILPDLAEGCV